MLTQPLDSFRLVGPLHAIHSIMVSIPPSAFSTKSTEETGEPLSAEWLLYMCYCRVGESNTLPHLCQEKQPPNGGKAVAESA